MNERGKADVHALAHANRCACGEMSESIRLIANKGALEVAHGCTDENELDRGVALQSEDY